jgi:putative oxygen-independent coproporphyrinogen III oxidase
MSDIQTSLYVHIPWCVRKCPYCDFNSHKAPDNIPQEQYIDCLLEDLKKDLEHYSMDKPLHTIFIGGGTPSLFSAKNIDRLLAGVDTQWSIANNTEITMEVNPGTVEQRHFSNYKAAGINRLSLGIQSFSDIQLKNLGRIHTADEAIKAIETVRDSGFDNMNIDIMFGLPEQTIEQGLEDLTQAIALEPAHISWYQLTLEPNTVFYKKPPKLPNHDAIADCHQLGQALLSDAGFKQYEISAYAKNSAQCQHNLNYWQYGDYLGIGAGAHGKITAEDARVIRSRKMKQPDSYLKRYGDNYRAAEQIIPPEDQSFEYLLNRLRLNAPIALSEIPKQLSLSHSSGEILEDAISKGFLTINNNTIHKTPLGEKFLDDLLVLFL